MDTVLKAHKGQTIQKIWKDYTLTGVIWQSKNPDMCFIDGSSY